MNKKRHGRGREPHRYRALQHHPEHREHDEAESRHRFARCCVLIEQRITFIDEDILYMDWPEPWEELRAGSEYDLLSPDEQKQLYSATEILFQSAKANTMMAEDGAQEFGQYDYTDVAPEHQVGFALFQEIVGSQPNWQIEVTCRGGCLTLHFLDKSDFMQWMSIVKGQAVEDVGGGYQLQLKIGQYTLSNLIYINAHTGQFRTPHMIESTFDHEHQHGITSVYELAATAQQERAINSSDEVKAIRHEVLSFMRQGVSDISDRVQAYRNLLGALEPGVRSGAEQILNKIEEPWKMFLLDAAVLQQEDTIKPLVTYQLLNEPLSAFPARIQEAMIFYQQRMRNAEEALRPYTIILDKSNREVLNNTETRVPEVALPALTKMKKLLRQSRNTQKAYIANAITGYTKNDSLFVHAQKEKAEYEVAMQELQKHLQDVMPITERVYDSLGREAVRDEQVNRPYREIVFDILRQTPPFSAECMHMQHGQEQKLVEATAVFGQFAAAVRTQLPAEQVRVKTVRFYHAQTTLEPPRIQCAIEYVIDNHLQTTVVVSIPISSPASV